MMPKSGIKLDIILMSVWMVTLSSCVISPPIVDPKHESFKTVFTADLTGNSLSPDEMLNNTISLAELLVLYQDSPDSDYSRFRNLNSILVTYPRRFRRFRKRRLIPVVIDLSETSTF